jgi:cytochrome P450
MRYSASLAAMQVRRTLPFGAGARACIGMPLAQLILPTTIATLLGRFSFRLAKHVSQTVIEHAGHVQYLLSKSTLQSCPVQLLTAGMQSM